MHPPQAVHVLRAGPSPPKKGSGNVCPAGCALSGFEDADVRAIKGVAAAGRFGAFLQQTVGGSENAVLDHAQHA